MGTGGPSLLKTLTSVYLVQFNFSVSLNSANLSLKHLRPTLFIPLILAFGTLFLSRSLASLFIRISALEFCLLFFYLSPVQIPLYLESFGAPSGTRTRDPLIKSQLLYQLS